ncbi:hypothetical protein HDU76_012999 [Blyttiomyces sp. JEL0837]|nr:hypothetical protein HDU76_012999 [Blyttiomyces sp. JEL0837]
MAAPFLPTGLINDGTAITSFPKYRGEFLNVTSRISALGDLDECEELASTDERPVAQSAPEQGRDVLKKAQRNRTNSFGQNLANRSKHSITRRQYGLPVTMKEETAVKLVTHEDAITTRQTDEEMKALYEKLNHLDTTKTAVSTGEQNPTFLNTRRPSLEEGYGANTAEVEKVKKATKGRDSIFAQGKLASKAEYPFPVMKRDLNEVNLAWRLSISDIDDDTDRSSRVHFSPDITFINSSIPSDFDQNDDEYGNSDDVASEGVSSTVTAASVAAEPTKPIASSALNLRTSSETRIAVSFVESQEASSSTPASETRASKTGKEEPPRVSLRTLDSGYESGRSSNAWLLDRLSQPITSQLQTANSMSKVEAMAGDKLSPLGVSAIEVRRHSIPPRATYPAQKEIPPFRFSSMSSSSGSQPICTIEEERVEKEEEEDMTSFACSSSFAVSNDKPLCLPEVVENENTQQIQYKALHLEIEEDSFEPWTRTVWNKFSHSLKSAFKSPAQRRKEKKGKMPITSVASGDDGHQEYWCQRY